MRTRPGITQATLRFQTHFQDLAAGAERYGPFDRAWRTRNAVERLIARCKQWRGLATRHEELAATYRTPWVTAATILLL